MSGGFRELAPDGYGFGRLRILLIDRQRTPVGRLLAQLLDAAAFSQHSSLRSAYAALENEEFDAVLIGLRLSRQERAAACQRLVQAARGAPVIVLLDHDQVIDLREGIEAGAAGFYYKGEMAGGVVRRVLQPALQFRMRRLAAA